MPASPWMGSTSTAAMSRVRPAMAVMASRSPNGARTKPPTSGSNPACALRLPVAESAAIVRPWKLCSMTMTPGHAWPRAWPYNLVIFSAPSMASAPELPKNTRSMPVKQATLPASFSCQGMRTRLPVWIRVAAWSAITAASAGCAWPSAQTPSPLIASR